MDSVSISDIIMCIILLAACISLIPILKFEVSKVRKIRNVQKNSTVSETYNNTSSTVRACEISYRALTCRGFMLSYFILIVLIVMIVLIIVMKSIL
ncbi:MAG: hypothetical protein GXO10_04195 [Crenarchaeota archaeon]|nr:hypothetical protein [Thermoproteota archaeon]